MLNDWRYYIVVFFAVFNILVFFVLRDNHVYLQQLNNFTPTRIHVIETSSHDIAIDDPLEYFHPPTLPTSPPSPLTIPPLPCQYSSIVSCLFHKKKVLSSSFMLYCGWNIKGRVCVVPNHSKMPYLQKRGQFNVSSLVCEYVVLQLMVEINLIKGQIAYSADGYDAGVGTFNQVCCYTIC